MSTQYPQGGYPPPGSGIPPNQPPPPPPPVWNPQTGQYEYPQQSAPPPPPPNPWQQPTPPGYPQPPQYTAAPPQQQQWGAQLPAAGDMTFGEIAWTGGLPLGEYLARLDDIEPGVTGNGNNKLTLTATTVASAGDVAAGRKAVWSYTLTEASIGKLGKDMLNAGVDGNTRFSREPGVLAQQLLAQLKGVVLQLSATQRRDGDGTQLGIVGRQGAQAPTQPQNPPPYVPQQSVAPAYVTPPPPPTPPYQQPPPGTSGFHQV